MLTLHKLVFQTNVRVMTDELVTYHQELDINFETLSL